ncbi:MAG: hypothetical protein FWF85_05890 [Clostridiales bacterium]|nr:hypothetical protein [Clostridiales bacterium]
MIKYPVKIDSLIMEYEQLNGKIADPKFKEILKGLATLENIAYEQGLNDGCLRALSFEEKESAGHSYQDITIASEIHEIVSDYFVVEGFSKAMGNMGVVPEDASWGEKIYSIALWSFKHGIEVGIDLDAKLKKEEYANA